MQIRTTNTFSPNFQAIHIANAKNYLGNIETNIKLYELNSNKDKSFLKDLPVKIKMYKLMPDLTPDNYDRWHEMLEYATDKALSPDRKTLLAVVDNKPCGIAVFLPGKNKFHLDCICTWPIEYGKKVKLAGTTLFKQMFEIFQDSKADRIQLEAITDGPFDTVSKYKNLGFTEWGGRSNQIFMQTTAPKVKKTMKYLDDLILTEKIKNSYKENLNEILDLQI